MQYFVSVENSNFFYWQLELLIESFLRYELQENLVIAVAENESPKIKEYTKNLVKHGVKIVLPNIGKEKQYLPANRIYSLHKLYEENVIKLPFAIIHSDMVLRSPLEKYNDLDSDIIINNYDVKNKLVEDLLEEEEFKERIFSNVSLPEDFKSFDFISSMPIIFNESLNKNIFDKFLDKLIINLEYLLKIKGTEFPCEQAAWKLTFLEAIGHYKATGKLLTSDLFSPNDTPFIHYNFGIPPVFSKRFFKFDNSNYYYDGPFENLMQHDISENTKYIHNLLKSYKIKSK